MKIKIIRPLPACIGLSKIKKIRGNPGIPRADKKENKNEIIVTDNNLNGLHLHLYY